MFDLSLPLTAAWINAAIFAVAGLINLAGLKSVREVYANWDVPALTYRTLGLIELVAAAFLATPEFRFWGVLLAAPIIFGSVVLLLDHRNYLVAGSVIVLLIGLGAAIFAIPPSHEYVSYAAESSTY
jgi:DoxX-like protein